MSYEMNDDSFTLFKNDKEGNENRPDYKGKIKINGVEKAIAAWIKTSKNGNKYMSGKVSDFKPMPQEAKQAAYTGKEDVGGDPFSDEIPFARFMDDII